MKRIIIWQMNGVMNAGGTESLIMELLRNKPEDVEVKLIVHSADNNFEGVFTDEINKLGIPTYHLPSVGSVGIKKYEEEFGKLVKKIGRPDVIHSHINATGGFIAKAAQKYKIPCRIVHCHADVTFRGNWLHILKEEVSLFLMKIFVNHYANYYWGCSEAATKRLFYKGKKCTVIPNVINVEKFLNSSEQKTREKELLRISDERIVVGAVGRIAPIKNYEVIIDAIKILVSRGVNAHFYCYGRVGEQRYYDAVVRRVKENQLDGNVHFLGNSTRIAEAISAFDIFVMPSITEGLGISALEAQAAGIPTILSTGVPTETDMGIGLVTRIDSNDATAWADAIRNIRFEKVDKEKILNVFSKKGYDSKVKCHEIYDMYKKMAEGK